MTFNWNSKVILVAEDEPANFLFIEKILHPTQATLLRAENGSEAIDIIKNNSNINLVLMDIYMPGIDGFEASKQIKQIRPELPIIAQTFHEEQIEREKIESAQFDSLLKNR
jgi:CheY-like chemotaxis protein